MPAQRSPNNLKGFSLQPWAKGPFELLKHADGHLRLGADTDRRIALIGLDNAIEVCIEVFLRLHPRLRDGFEIQREDVERSLRSFHSKIEFFERYTQERNIVLESSIEAIVWYHSLRNELYHSGNGMVPELHVLEGARAAAIEVFKVIFGPDAAGQLGVRHQAPTPADESPLVVGQTEEMDFLRAYNDFRKVLLRVATRSWSAASATSSVLSLWASCLRAHPDGMAWDGQVKDAVVARNAIVHGRPEEMEAQAVPDLAAALAAVTAWLTQLR